jgi:hypothetical protein
VMATRVGGRSTGRAGSGGYTLMVPPEDERFARSPVWVRDRGRGEVGGLTPVRLAAALAGTGRRVRRGEMVAEHVGALVEWTELAGTLLDESVPDDRRREEMGMALVFFAGDLGRALGPGGAGEEADPELCLLAVAAITGAMVVAADCLERSFSRQLVSTG